MKKTMTLPIPMGLILLCDLLDTTPEELLKGFIHDLSRTPESKGEAQRILAGKYFLLCGYGRHSFSCDQVDEMLLELSKMLYERCQLGKAEEVEYQRHIRKRLTEWNTRWNEIKKPQLLSMK